MLASPNAIPPRTSSSGISSNHQQQIDNTLSTPRYVLKPVDEANWLAQTLAQHILPVPASTPPHTNFPKASTNKNQYPTSSSSRSGSPPNGGSSTANMAQQPPLAPLTKAADAPPPPDPNRYAHDDLDFGPNRSWNADKEGIVRAPFDYVISHPGKDFRAQLIGAFNAWLNVPEDSLAVITRVVGMLHESSLLVDDVQDMSELRRGYPVAHSIFGVAQTINSANYIYFAALQEVQKLKSPDAVSIFANELVNLHRGQGMDLFWRDTLTCPSEDDYLEMVGNKTGGLFRLGIKLMQAESPLAAGEIDCVPLVNLVGLVFQIRDDYMNLSSSEYESNKGMCEDLTEGKFSFPVLHSIRANPSNRQLISILKQKTTDVQVKQYAVRYMESTGSFDYTRQVLDVLIKRARRVAEQTDGGRGKMDGISKIIDKMVVQ